MNARITFLSDAHIYHFPEQELELRFERFSEDKREGLIAELTATTSLQPKPGLLFHGRVNLASSRSRYAAVKAMASRATDAWHGDTDFAGIMEYVCYQSQRRWREGEPCIDLRDVDPTARPKWLLEPFLEQVGATNVFADGGSGKSTIVLAMGLTIASGVPLFGDLRVPPTPVLYLDWEADEYVHAERLNALCKGHGIDRALAQVYYRRQVASLMESVSAIRKEIATLGVGAVIIDSMGAARGGEPESADVTIRVYQAARSLGVPWIGVDHITKDQGNKDKPFGSVYSHNLSRRTWALEKVQEEGQDEIVVAMVNKKANNGVLARRRAYRIRYQNDGDFLNAIEISPADITAIPEFAASLPLKQRILAYLRDANGKVSRADLIDDLDLLDKQDQLRARLNEMVREGSIVKVGDYYALPSPYTQPYTPVQNGSNGHRTGEQGVFG